MTQPDWLPPPMLPPSVSVWSAGVLLADGREGGSPLAPMVLSGLRVEWGRATILDQPPPATCTLSMLDLVGGQSFREVVAIGGALNVQADALLTPDSGPVRPVISLPFDTATPVPPMVLGNATAVISGGKLNVTPKDASKAAVVTFPPGKPEPVGGNPAAWDAIPRALEGESWTGSALLTAPTGPFAGFNGWSVTLQPVTYNAPWATPKALAAIPGGSGTFVPTPRMWVGLRATFTPGGPRWNQLDASSWDSLAASWTWASLSAFTADNVTLTAPPAGTLRSALVFTGRVTDMEARFDNASGATLIDITAQDMRAELANRDVGDVPWLAETLAARVARIVTASGQPITYRIDASMTGLPISWRDVDRQGALTLLQEMAISGDGVLWAAASLTTGPYLDFESLNERPALSGLTQGANGIVIIGPITDVPGSLRLDACSLSRDPVRWIQDVADVSTRVATTWRQQTLDDKGNPAPTDRVENVIDAELEKSIGSRRIAISTQLSASAPALQLASNTLGRTSTPGWRLSGLTWDAEDDAPLASSELTKMMTLLDGTTRNGCPIVVTDLPDWSPLAEGRTEVPLFVEGGTYTNEDGAWHLDMTTSAPTAAGRSATWNDFPSTPHPVTAWRWQDMAPDISWVDLSGTAVI